MLIAYGAIYHKFGAKCNVTIAYNHLTC